MLLYRKEHNLVLLGKEVKVSFAAQRAAASVHRAERLTVLASMLQLLGLSHSELGLK